MIGSEENEPIQLSNVKLQVEEETAEKLPAQKKLTLILARLKPDTKPESLEQLFKDKELPEPAEVTLIEKEKALAVLGLNSARKDVVSASVIRRRRKLENFAGEDSAFASLKFENRDDSK